MKHAPILAGLILQSLSLLALAQAPATPAPRPAPISSPEVAADRHVTFRLRAAQAHEVSVNSQALPGKVAMTRADNGDWSATVGPVEPGVWEYSFNVDGLEMIDPANPAIKPQRSPKTSILAVPGNPPLLWDWQDVAHGTLHEHSYRSKPAANTVRRLHVYTPPGYERDTALKYRVLYLVHGSGDNDAAWSAHGKANLILDNLIAQGLAKPMIVVMPDGHPVPPGAVAAAFNGKSNSEVFESEMMEVVLPLIESTYRVEAGSANRALAGLSMGGGHALFTGLRHVDTFGSIGAFSAGIPGKDNLVDALADPAALNQKLRVFWMACGKKDFLLERNKQLEADLTAKGIHHTWVESEGAHAWPVWRNYLSEFAPLLFK